MRFHNDEKEGDEGEAIIFGSDFDTLMDALVPVLVELAQKIDPNSELDTENWESNRL